MRRNAVPLLFMVLLTSCSMSITSHDENAAAKKALRFGEIVFVAGKVEDGYQILTEQAKQSLSLQEFKDVIRQMHPKSVPVALTATDYEPIPGQKAMNIYLLGKNENEDFYYKLIMFGTAPTGYKVAGFSRGSGPYPPNKLRHTLAPSASTNKKKNEGTCLRS